jgi:hypothetical protein
MNKHRYRETIVFVAALPAALGLLGCLDLTLLDDMARVDTDSDNGNPRSAPASTVGTGDPASDTPVVDPSDATPPAMVSTDCGGDERPEERLCIADGAAAVSFRFDTDEPADASCEGTGGCECRVLSEVWATSHHVAMTGLTDTEISTRLTLTDINGNSQSIDISGRGIAGPTVAITEVLADPLGPEPDQEFIEIVNYGESPADLSGWAIDDNGDRNGDTIPESIVLGPGQVGLLVAPDYQPQASGEPALAEGALLIRLDSSIASNGLKNSESETIELYDAAGSLVSAYPGSAGPPSEGVSVVRILPQLPDGDPMAFVTHPEKAASPGVVDSF